MPVALLSRSRANNLQEWSQPALELEPTNLGTSMK
jgi:hypothetical protein